jgi:hypothetical protein
MKAVISADYTGKHPTKLGEAELHFDEKDGVLDGMKLVGFAIWTNHHQGSERDHKVTFPSRTYSVNGDRRSFAILRPHNTDHIATRRIVAVVENAWGA